MRALSAMLPVIAALGLAACGRSPTAREATDFGGHPHRGAKLIAQLGCGTCHSVPGVRDAYGRVGPPLGGVAGRTIIAGVLPNTPKNMIAWLEAPQRFVPGNVMPNMGIDSHDARDIAAYLYTLR